MFNSMTTKLKVFFNYLIRITIFGVSMVFLYIQFDRKITSGGFLTELKQTELHDQFYFFLFGIFLLMFLNWGLEIFKWNLLTKHFTKLSMMKCIKGVISGITISMFLPNRIGDVAGKILWLESGFRWKGFFANIYASLGQIIATLFVSLMSLIILNQDNFDDKLIIINGSTLITLAGLSLAIALFAFFYLGWISKVFSQIKNKWAVRILQNSHILALFSLKTKLIVIMLSIVRFLVYTFQFYLFLVAFGVHISITEGMMIISIVYLLITIVPQFAIAEIATRGAITVLVFNIFLISENWFASDKETILLLTSTSLWLINLFIPAMAGLTMLPNLKRLNLVKS